MKEKLNRQEQFNKNPFKMTKRENAISNSFMLLVHLLFFFWYLFAHMPILFYYNLVSIAVFLFNFYLIRKNQFLWVSYLNFAEIFIFMTINTVCLGWEYGFQLYCFGFLTSALLFDSLTGEDSRISGGVLRFIVLNFMWFILLRIWTYLRDPVYVSDHSVMQIILFLLNAIATMSLIMSFVLSHLKKSRSLEKQLRFMAMRDELTGLYNRRYADQYMRKELRENGMDSWNIAILDIDHFKEINDRYGHSAGDEVLRDLGGLLGVQFSARWGGEEFLLATQGDVSQFEELRERIASHATLVEGTPISWTVTIGVCRSGEGTSFDEMLQIADNKLYQGKSEGRNVVVTDF